MRVQTATWSSLSGYFSIHTHEELFFPPGEGELTESKKLKKKIKKKKKIPQRTPKREPEVKQNSYSFSC